MMIDFFGTTPGLLSLAALALVLILISVFRRLAARARARRAATGSAAPAGEERLPRWAIAAIAAWAAGEAGGGAREAPSAAAWTGTARTAAAGERDPWREAGWRKVGVTR
jgi:hypothetical protein